MRFLIATVLALILTTSVIADEKLKGIACRSVHVAYTAPAATAFYTEATIEKSADGTYFMAAGFRGGYFGIQEQGNGKKVVLFSVWDPTAGNDPKKVAEADRVKTLHKDDAVRVGRFGGEGTGGQSFLDYDWKVGDTYRFYVTVAADGPDRTAFSGYFYLADKKAWKHLVTFSTPTKTKTLEGLYSFVEDFKRNKVSATKVRKAAFGNGWVKTTKGEWVEITKARFTADANPVTNIDAGTEGNHFFLATGGDTENKTTKLKESMERKSTGKAPTDLPETK